MLSIVISLTALQYAFIFPAAIVLRKKYPDGTGPIACPAEPSACGSASSPPRSIIVLTSISLLWPGLIDNTLGASYDIVSSWGTSRVFFETVTLGTLAGVVVMALVFWWVGKRNLASGAVGESDLLAVATPASAPGPAPETAAEPLGVVE